MIGIYKITNLTNNKVYIGQSVLIEKRWNKHQTAGFNPNGHEYEYPLYRAIRKYGLNNFSFEVIEECSREVLDERESYWIDNFQSNNPAFGYNQTAGGQSQVHFNKLNYVSLQEIKDLLKNSSTMLKDIAAEYGVSLITIKDINQGHSWHDETEDYPLRKAKKYFCENCGKEISKGARYCVDCRHLLDRICDRPSREELKDLIRNQPFTAIAAKYGVSDKAIVKWCVAMNLPSRKKDIKQYSEEQWLLI